MNFDFLIYIKIYGPLILGLVIFYLINFLVNIWWIYSVYLKYIYSPKNLDI